jgi:hypothetical protein
LNTSAASEPRRRMASARGLRPVPFRQSPVEHEARDAAAADARPAAAWPTASICDWRGGCSGRGCLAGPLVARGGPRLCSCAFPPAQGSHRFEAFSPEAREAMFQAVLRSALQVTWVSCSPCTIDGQGLHRSNLSALVGLGASGMNTGWRSSTASSWSPRVARPSPSGR